MDALQLLELTDNLTDALEQLSSVDQDDALSVLDAVEAVQLALEAMGEDRIDVNHGGMAPNLFIEGADVAPESVSGAALIEQLNQSGIGGRDYAFLKSVIDGRYPKGSERFYDAMGRVDSILAIKTITPLIKDVADQAMKMLDPNHVPEPMPEPVAEEIATPETAQPVGKAVLKKEAEALNRHVQYFITDMAGYRETDYAIQDIPRRAVEYFQEIDEILARPFGKLAAPLRPDVERYKEYLDDAVAKRIAWSPRAAQAQAEGFPELDYLKDKFPQYWKNRATVDTPTDQADNTPNPFYQSILDGAPLTLDLLKQALAEVEKDPTHWQVKPVYDSLVQQVEALENAA